MSDLLVPNHFDETKQYVGLHLLLLTESVVQSVPVMNTCKWTIFSPSPKSAMFVSGRP